ncbi:MAG: exo-alpha-sialidase [Candidatus Hydrogenedentes bacterium]|nr:exo-alpha-sialidase [Candidatus Hydrogenedentota bacterium]
MLTLLVAAAAFSALNTPLYNSELIFPMDPKHNHGSSIVECPNGELLACWFHGSGERKEDDVLVQGARLGKKSKEWSPVFVMADTPGLPDCNPVLFIDPRKTLWLFWIAVQDNEWGGSLLKYRTSTHYAKKGAPKWDWQDDIHCRPVDLEPAMLDAITKAQGKYAAVLDADPKLKAELEDLKKASHVKLTQRLGWMTRLHPIMTSDKRMMLGLYSDVFNTSLAAFTEDWGKTWQFSKPIITPDLGNIQPSFVPKKDGGIVAFMRDNGIPQQIRRAESKDKGISWSEVTTLDIPNPGSSVDCIALKNGRWVLVCNDLKDGRHRLTAYLSEDEGTTWPVKRPLEDFQPDKGSGSYPSLIQAKDGSLHCTYSYSNKETPGESIKHVRFNEAWLRASEK